ncbi:outer membrane beta-barrel protein [Prevotella sp. P6B1]|uniref:outer membrane beta-barrel protein n=1 Tax=Prevotella sp. P6B1 TaxID=1410613 RepID=UPI00051AACFB|nr:outer membrane beta-barrel protein [Prevotella sp. P6B1]
MKKLMMIAAMMLAAVTVSAQEAGQVFLKPMVGATLTNVTKIEGKMKFGEVAGAELGYMLSDNFGLSVGALYTMQGEKGKNNVGDFKLEYVNVPILANCYVAPGFALKAGVQFGFMTKAKNSNVDFKEYCNKTDISIPLGAAYEFGDFVIDARYNFGLSKIVKKDYTDESYKNSVIMLTLGYKIPF